MPEERKEETRYCPTCQKKTPHWVTVTAIPNPDLQQTSPQSRSLKTECRICRTVES